MNTESSIMKPYVWRPGAMEMVTDHKSPSADRVMGDSAAFHRLKSPTTETRCADPL